MKTAPQSIGGAQVVMFSPIDDRHRPTGACRHVVGGMEQPSFAGLAVCQHEGDGGFYLFYCDENWHPVTDMFHATPADAMRQAEFEYDGVSQTWQRH